MNTMGHIPKESSSTQQSLAGRVVAVEQRYMGIAERNRSAIVALVVSCGVDGGGCDKVLEIEESKRGLGHY